MKSLRTSASALPVDALCGLFGHTKQAFYQWNRRKFKEKCEEQAIVEIIRDIRSEMPRIGVRKLRQLLILDYGLYCGRDRLFDILRRERLLVKRRRRKPRTTYSGHIFPVYPNLVSSLTPVRPNHVWVSDITYVRVEGRFMYLFLITDMFSRKVIGWSLADDMAVPHALEALKMALRQRKGKGVETIHHSDRGSQYCCAEYVRLLKRHGISISMTENGDPRENAYAERVNGTIKEEFINPLNPGRSSVLRVVRESISTYNDRRPHASLVILTPEPVMLTPSAAHSMECEPMRGWKHYPWYRKDIPNGNATFVPDREQDPEAFP